MRYTICLSYDGSAFCGWQIQTAAPSVQESLQVALKTLLKETVNVTGAGRTDSAVNAVGYTAHFDADAAIEPEVLACKLNAILPREIIVHSIKKADDDFHARFDARKREYKYFIHRRKDPFAGKYSWHCGYPLDVAAMNKACEELLGTHDFSCFEKSGGNAKTSVCTVFEAGWAPYEPGHVLELGYPCEDGDYLVFTVSANRFLRNMVRAIVGTCIDIGRGRRDAGWMHEVMASGTRSSAGESVPGHALFLCRVEYWK